MQFPAANLTVQPEIASRGELCCRIEAVAPPHGDALGFATVYNGGLYQSSLYAVAKGGTLTLTRSFASRLAKFSICVNTVARGPVNTPMFSYKLTDTNIAEFKGKMPMGRIGEPIEIARVVAFLSSPWASYITGQVIDANGGQLFR